MNRLITHRIALLLLLLIPVLALGSCKKNRSIKPLSQLTREQRQAIDRLIKESSFTVKELNSETLPSTIDPDVFYRLSNGLYIRVLDKGTTRTEANKTTVSVQLKGYFFNVSQSKGAIFDNLTETNVRPLFFRYASWETSEGKIHYSSLNESGVYEDLICEGVAFPMSLLGDGAIVQLIIPFDLGPSQNYTAGNSLFVEKAVYTFYTKPQQ